MGVHMIARTQIFGKNYNELSELLFRGYETENNYELSY